MAEVTVKHYRSASVHSTHKELVTERVTQDSETGRFLQKMETKRLLRVCFETIDMRGKVPGDCRRYVLNNRVFFLDDTSYGIYQQGLKTYNGVFTVATYEAIVNGKHTNRAIRDAQIAREHARQERAAVRERGAATGTGAGPEAEAEAGRDLFQPEVVPFGYFKKRSEERLQYVTAVDVRIGSKILSGTTRDISVSGLQIVFKGLYRFEPGCEITVSMQSLQEQTDKVDLQNIRYRIVSSEQIDAEHQLRVQLADDEPPPGFAQFVVELIERYKRKYKLDVEDDFWSVCSWLYERIYTESMMQLSAFVAMDEHDRFFTQAIAITDGNLPFAHFFRNDVDNYDFSALCLPERLTRLRDRGEIMLMLYREKIGDEYRIHSVADFELDEASFKTFLRFTLAHEEHCIVKMIASGDPLREISPKKFEMLTGRLLEKSEDEVRYLRERLDEIVFAAVVVDITEQMKSAIASQQGLELQTIDVHDLRCWVGGSCRQLPLGQEVGRADSLVVPEMIRFGYVERRREDRYLAETAVEVITPAGRVKGRTRDISKRGLAVKTEQRIQVAEGEEIKVALVSLQAKRPSLDLSSVPYRVVKVEEGTSTVIMLERMRNKLEYEIDDFFVELITKNRHKLAVDINDTRGASLSRVYEAMISENAASIPFFIARGDEGGAQLQKVAVPEGNCPLADFFRGADGSADFSWLTDSRLVLALYQEIIRMARHSGVERQRPSPVDIEVYCYRSAPEAGGEAQFRIATELEFGDDVQRQAFIAAMTAAADFRVLKLMATYSLELNKLELDTTIESIRSQSKHRALKLQEQLHAIVGYGEIIDMTAQYRLTQRLIAG